MPLVDKAIDSAIQLATIEHGINLAAVLIFGSIVRGDFTESSDIDVIVLLYSGMLQEPVYTRRHIDIGINADWNVTTIPALERVLADAFWHYRLQNAKIVYSVHALRYELDRWFREIAEMIRSSAARNTRICYLTHWERRMIQLGKHASKGSKWLFCLEALNLAMCRAHELEYLFPYSTRNPIIVASSSSNLSNAARRLLERVLVHNSADQAWSILKRGLSIGRAKVFGDDNIRQAKQHAAYQDSDSELQLGVPPDGLDWDVDNIESALREWKPGVLPSQRKPYPKALKGISKKRNKSGIARVSNYDEVKSRWKVILPTGGCRVSRCIFCSLRDMARFNVNKLQSLLLEPPSSVEEMAVYTDGSFFDDRELSAQERLQVAKRVHELGVRRLTVESLPMFMTNDRLKPFCEILGDTRLEIGVGIQSTNATVREKLLGVPISSYELDSIWRAAQKHNFLIRAYLLCGKPLLTSEEDAEDVISSVEAINVHAKVISRITLNLILPTENTVVAELARIQRYRWPCRCWLSLLFGRCRTLSSFPVEMGNLDSPTCSLKHDDRLCKNCDGLGIEPISNLRSRLYAFPWAVVGGIETRISVAAEFLHKGGPSR